MEESKEVELEFSSPEKESYFESPFREKVHQNEELRDEVIETLGSEFNAEAKNESIKVLDEIESSNIVITDEINARLAFKYFNDQELKKEGKEAFEDKVERIAKQLNKIKTLVKHRRSNKLEDSKDEVTDNFLEEIEKMQSQTKRIVNPADLDTVITQFQNIKPLTESLLKLSTKENEEESSENVVYELMYNKD